MLNSRRFVPVDAPIILIQKMSYGSLCGRGSETLLASDGRLEDGWSQWRNRLPLCEGGELVLFCPEKKGLQQGVEEGESNQK
jgi:hypothetical protein